jgi:hypothetical protein
MNFKTRSGQTLQKALAKNPSCYVLITCTEPTEDGEMQVEMTYQGDAVLASYLLKGAQHFIEEQEELDVLPTINRIK